MRSFIAVAVAMLTMLSSQALADDDAKYYERPMSIVYSTDNPKACDYYTFLADIFEGNGNKKAQVHPGFAYTDKAEKYDQDTTTWTVVIPSNVTRFQVDQPSWGYPQGTKSYSWWDGQVDYAASIDNAHTFLVNRYVIGFGYYGEIEDGETFTLNKDGLVSSKKGTIKASTQTWQTSTMKFGNSFKTKSALDWPPANDNEWLVQLQSGSCYTS